MRTDLRGMNLRNFVIRSCTWIGCLLPLLLNHVDAFSTSPKLFRSQIPTHGLPINYLSTQLSASDTNQKQSRRMFFQVTSAIVFGTLIPHSNDSAWAAEKEPIIWKSGKTPIVPGQKPKDKNDVSGTRKDPSFLRSISACKVRHFGGSFLSQPLLNVFVFLFVFHALMMVLQTP